MFFPRTQVHLHRYPSATQPPPSGGGGGSGAQAQAQQQAQQAAAAAAQAEWLVPPSDFPPPGLAEDLQQLENWPPWLVRVPHAAEERRCAKRSSSHASSVKPVLYALLPTIPAASAQRPRPQAAAVGFLFEVAACVLRAAEGGRHLPSAVVVLGWLRRRARSRARITRSFLASAPQPASLLSHKKHAESTIIIALLRSLRPTPQLTKSSHLLLYKQPFSPQERGPAGASDGGLRVP